MIGRTVLTNNSIMPTRVSADGSPKYKSGGVTLDWGTVTAVSGSDAVLPDGSVIRIGQKYMRYGQVICKMSAAAANTQQTLTGGATGGSFTLTLTRPDTNQSVTTAAIAWNASAATILAAIQAVLAPGQAVSSSGGILPAAVTVVFGTFFPIMTVNGALLTGGTVTPAVTVVGTMGGYYGPYDPAATDGRAVLARGDCFVLDETVLQYDTATAALGGATDQTGGAIEGGDVYLNRIIQSGVAAHTLALGPTRAELDAVFPRFSYVTD